MLACAAFVYVTAEIMPVGALPQIAADLRVSEAVVGTLLAGYALVAAVATVPLVRWTSGWPRRRTLIATLLCLVISQLISALAPTFAVLAAGRVLCATTHGLMWSVIAPIGARLVPATHAARATMAVYIGTGSALVVGSPLTAALSQAWGWRPAVAAIAVAAAVVVVAARFALPLMATPAGRVTRPGRRMGARSDRRLLAMCALTLVGVTGHFVSYTFIVVVIRDVVGLTGPGLAWLLAGYGVAGLVTMGLLARPGDRHPKAAVAGCLAGLTLVLGVLAAMGPAGAGGVWAIGVVAVIGWGATATAVPPMLQTAAMRHCPEDPDRASGLYVACFQVGIMSGSLIGGLLIGRAGVSELLAVSALLVAGALVGVLASRDLFGAV